jgi:hypothetical protein
MKSVFFTLCALVCGSVLAGEYPSVVNHNQAPAPAVAAPAPAPAPAAAPCVNCPANEVLVVESQPARQIVIVDGAPRRCVNGRCSSSSSSVCTGPNCQKYAITENNTETVRKRWVGGGYVIRNNGRTVVKPVR